MIPETGSSLIDARSPVSRRTLIIANPCSYNYSVSNLASLVSRLRQFGFFVEIIEATAPGEISEAARTAEFQAILIAGGDGSINAVIEGLLDRPPPRPTVGVIPMGLGNVLAYELGLPQRPESLADLFNDGNSKPLRLGLANGRPFLLMASAGFDAKIVKAVEASGLKRRLGRLAYAYQILAAFIRGNSDSIEVNIGGRIIISEIAIVTKSRYYGGKFEIAPDLGVFVPGLKLIAVTRLDASMLTALCGMFLFGKLRNFAFIEVASVGHVEMRSTRGVATQVDGDYHGVTPMVIQECPETIDIFCY